jgi:DNA polymerase-3 subunit epsilon
VTARLSDGAEAVSTLAVIDFETTGISPAQGDRPTEVAIVRLEHGVVVDRFQSLMNPGVRIPAFITQLTGITNAMVQTAPPVGQVMAEAARFVGQSPMVAHNASFDRKVWQAELHRLGLPALQPFACTVLLARRLLPQAPNHQLGTLVRHLGLPCTGRAHRALADAEMAAELLLHLQGLLRTHHGLAHAGHPLLMGLQACTRAAVPRWLQQQARLQAIQGPSA